MLIAFLMLAATAPDPTALAAKGLKAVVEDDIGKGGDRTLLSVRTKGCTTRVKAKGRSWSIDWTKAEGVAREDTFVFIAAPKVRIAIVGDASIPDQDAKLTALAQAMQAVLARCQAKV
jgi:hypothetical protein